MTKKSSILSLVLAYFDELFGRITRNKKKEDSFRGRKMGEISRDVTEFQDLLGKCTQIYALIAR